MNMHIDTFARYASDEARFAAVTARDANADGIFYYSVRTSGVYCRPSCKARPALRKNVGFHISCADAEQAGFRACKRCKPNLPPPVCEANLRLRFAVGQCALGAVLVAASDKGISAILLGDDADVLADALHAQFPRRTIEAGGREMDGALAAVIRLIDNPSADFDRPLDIKGTAFQRRVWQALREIPAGTTASYAAVAERIGSPSAVRAAWASARSSRASAAQVKPWPPKC